MKLKILQTGEPTLRQQARPLTPEEIKSDRIQTLISLMKTTLYDAPGVGLAAPQIGESIQLILIEDKPEYTKDIPAEILAERERAPVPFHVIINPQLTIDEPDEAEFFEGCLSVAGFIGLTPRAKAVTVTCLNEHALPVTLKARGWYARILQHEIDHLHGKLYLERMQIRSFMSQENYLKYWKNASISHCRLKLGIPKSQ